jgi:hypothetical protein
MSTMRKPFDWMALTGLFLAGLLAGGLLTQYYDEGVTPLAVFRGITVASP